MLVIWPLVVLVLFKRLPPDRALIWSILGGYLILPPLAAINLPVVPDLDKESIPNLAALFMVLFVLKDRPTLLPESWVARGLILLFVLGPFATVLSNGDIVEKAGPDLQGMRVYDSIAAIANQAIELLPFFLARHYLASSGAMRATLVALMVAGLAYSIPMLIEIRMSPQMNVWIYGYFQHDFFQTIRFGGYRPVVFLPHGLWVAFFALMAVMSALYLFRLTPAQDRPRYFGAFGYLLVLLVLCKSAGVLVYAMFWLPVMFLLGRRWMLLAAAVVATMVIAYPALRGAHIVPLDEIVAWATERFGPDRAHSLSFRFQNEEALLAHAEQRPLFGWGGYGRNLLYDPITGQGVSIADGAWIINLGIYGWTGYVALFGLLALPLLMLGREALFARAEALCPYAAAVAVILAANMLDMLPNATVIPFTYLMAGALLGHAELAAQRRGDTSWLHRKAVFRRRPSRTVI